jgi:hypothetical protein
MSGPGGTVVRPYHERDVPQLVALFTRVFGSDISAEHWRWKLTANPSPACNVWLAVAEGKPVFQYAGIAQRYQLGGSIAIGFVSVDTMTDPDFRRRGLLTQVATRAYESWRAADAAFVIGLPNQQWGSRAAALGWQELFPLRWLARPLAPEAYLARRLRMPWLARIPGLDAAWNKWFDRRLRPSAEVEVAEVARADAGFDELWQRLRSAFSFSTVRDSAWVNWRFADSPSRRYQLLAARRAGRVVGYLAFRRVESGRRVTVHLAELVAEPHDGAARASLLVALMARARADRAELLVTLAIPGTALDRELRRAGFFAGPEFSVQAVPFAGSPPIEVLRQRERWFMTGADYDVV